MNAASANPVPTPAPAPRRRPRWIVRSLFGLLLVIVVFVAALPSLISWSPALRDMAIRGATGDVNGDITVESLSVGWFEPLSITKVIVTPRQGARAKPWQPALSIARVESDRGLWAMLTAPQDLGTVRVERPEVFVEVDQGHSNFATLFPKPAATPSEPKPPPTIPDIGARVRIVDGRFRFESDGTNPWELNGINLGVGLTAASKSTSGRPEAVVEKGTLINRQELTVGMCDDLLKFVAPVVAKAAYVQGAITIELDDWRLPLGDIGTGEMGGRLTLHSVETGPGPMTSQIHRTVTSLPIVNKWQQDLQLPKFIQIAHDSTVRFKMLPGGRIHHENLHFNIAGLVSVGTQGSVGLDETLDLTATFGIHPPNPEERVLALMRQLTDTEWPVNIRGTLSAPKIDASPLQTAFKDLVFKKLPADWASGRNSVGGNTLRRLQDLGIPVEPEDLARIGELIQQLQPPQPSTSAAGAQAAGGAIVPGGPQSPNGQLAPNGRPAPNGQPQQPVNAGQIVGDILSELLRRRQQMQAQRQQANGQYPGGPYQGGAYSPNQGPPNQFAPNGQPLVTPGATPYGAQPYGPDVPPLVAPGPPSGAPAPGTMSGPSTQPPPFAERRPFGQQPLFQQSPSQQPGGPFPRRPLLRKGLGLLRDTLEQALEPPPSAPAGAPTGTAPLGTAPLGTPTATPSSSARLF